MSLKPLHVHLRKEYLLDKEGQDFDWFVRDTAQSFRAKFIRWDGDNLILQRFTHVPNGIAYVDMDPLDPTTLQSVERIDVKLGRRR